MAEHLGVRYRYADTAADQQVKENMHSDMSSSLTAESLEAMSMDWVEQLHQSALRVNAKQILALIDQIPESENDLTWALIELVDRCSFKEIVAVTEVVMLQKATSSGGVGNRE
jgi:hypothetical protein